MKTELELLKEISERAVRLESRLVQLGDHVGANLRTRQRIDIGYNEAHGVFVTIDSLDVSVSRIVAELAADGRQHRTVPVFLKGKQVATVYP